MTTAQLIALPPGFVEADFLEEEFLAWEDEQENVCPACSGDGFTVERRYDSIDSSSFMLHPLRCVICGGRGEKNHA
jgi:hypothetical protein